MARKKKTPLSTEADANGSTSTPSPSPSPSLKPSASSSASSKAQEPQQSALIICRNKHWRYISSFHGPWLQLPPEVLEQLAHSNYWSPRPHPIDPAVFFDLVKIRKAVDEATNLAVRATSGLTSATLNNSLSLGQSMYGGASALGLGYGGGGGNAKLSAERKFRMRELATQKLSQAYHLDEIAASVAAMQGTSTLEDVAHIIMQRGNPSVDTRYVHFFHEKIPSRMMAEYTPLEPLNEIIAHQPSDAAPLRTRALTRMFKEDYVQSAKDLTDALSVCRYTMAQHKAGRDQLILAKDAQEQYERDRRDETRLQDEDQPTGLEAQLLFHRANVYLTIACNNIHYALEALRDVQMLRQQREESVNGNVDELPPPSTEEKDAHRTHLELRKVVKTNAKRGLKDYMDFLSHFDYTPKLPLEIIHEFMRRANELNGATMANTMANRRLLEEGGDRYNQALDLYQKSPNAAQGWPALPPPVVHQVSDLFSPVSLPNLPPYPPDPPLDLLQARYAQRPRDAASEAANAWADSHEAITYHPLLTDALHSLLLCHAVLQTPPKELLRHAHNAARLARVCDGYPIFLAPRSPARADWIEVLRRGNNWIGIGQSWEKLCRPTPSPVQASNGSSNASMRRGAGQGDRGYGVSGKQTAGDRGSPMTASDKALQVRVNGAGKVETGETAKQKRERVKHEAILDALADERVVDEDSFQRAVRAREKRALEDEDAVAKGIASPTGGVATPPALPPATDRKKPSVSVPPAPTVTTEVDDEKTTNGNTSTTTTPSSSKPPTPSPSTPTVEHEKPKRWTQDDRDRDYYPISTERAEAVSRWVREAPLVVEGAKKKSGNAAKKKKTKAPGVAGGTEGGLEESVGTLSLDGKDAEGEDEVD